MFSRRSEHHGRAIVPASANVSDDDSLDDDDDVADPHFLPQRHHDPETPGPSDAPPTTKGKRARPSLQMMEAQSSEDEDVEEDKDEEEEGESAGLQHPRRQKGQRLRRCMQGLQLGRKWTSLIQLCQLLSTPRLSM